jgi:hypothetical protein
MRTIHWLYLVVVVLFAASVVLFVRSGGATRRLADETRPVATVKQIMNAIVMPAAAVVFGSVAVIADTKGIDERQPRTEAEWALVGANAAALIEAGNLLMIGDRRRDNGQWITRSRAMMDAAGIALRAAEARDADALFNSGEAINLACDMCHTRYQAQAAE